MKFAEANELYDMSRHATATRELVSAPLTGRYAAGVRRLSRALDAFEGDELWSAVVRRCRRVLRELSTTPLEPSHPALDLASSADFLSGLIDTALGSYPDDLIARGELCVGAIRDLSEQQDNALGALAVEVLATGTLMRSGLVVQTPHLDEVQAWLSNAARGARLVTERELTTLIGLESLVIIGPSYWYPAHLLSAPRAELLCFVHFTWLRDRERDTRVFSDSPSAPGARIRASVTTYVSDGDEEVSAETLVPTLDWNALARAAGGHRRSKDDPESVEANLFLLVGGYTVHLEAVDGPTIYIIEVETGGVPGLRSKRTRAVTAGDYIVLRSEGGTGDYIPEIANAFLGSRARTLRSLQAEWKARLRTAVRERGFAAVERELRWLGVAYPNLRYRLWQHSIRTREPNDFRLLMEYVGLGDRASEIWTAMGDIFEAHVRAGQQVRRLLEEAVVATDVAALIQDGRADVRLRDIAAGTLSVFRVEGRAPDSIQIDEDDLRVIRQVEADVWQG